MRMVREAGFNTCMSGLTATGDPLNARSRGRSHGAAYYSATLATAILALLLLCAAPVSAQTSGETGQSFARGMSWFALGGGIGLATTEALTSDEKTKSALKLAASLALTGGSTLLAKTLHPEDRPCAPNNCGLEQPHASFWSGHVANACAVIPLKHGKAAFITGAALAGLTAVGRVWGNRHWLWPDVVVGCADGLVNNWLISRIH